MTPHQQVKCDAVALPENSLEKQLIGRCTTSRIRRQAADISHQKVGVLRGHSLGPLRARFVSLHPLLETLGGFRQVSDTLPGFERDSLSRMASIATAAARMKLGPVSDAQSPQSADDAGKARLLAFVILLTPCLRKQMQICNPLVISTYAQSRGFHRHLQNRIAFIVDRVSYVAQAGKLCVLRIGERGNCRPRIEIGLALFRNAFAAPAADDSAIEAKRRFGHLADMDSRDDFVAGQCACARNDRVAIVGWRSRNRIVGVIPARRHPQLPLLKEILFAPFCVVTPQ